VTAIAGAGVIATALEIAQAAVVEVVLLEGLVIDGSWLLGTDRRRLPGLLGALMRALRVLISFVLWHDWCSSAEEVRVEAAFLGL
jgi:hypothetical protein